MSDELTAEDWRLVIQLLTEDIDRGRAWNGRRYDHSYVSANRMHLTQRLLEKAVEQVRAVECVERRTG